MSLHLGVADVQLGLHLIDDSIGQVDSTANRGITGHFLGSPAG